MSSMCDHGQLNYCEKCPPEIRRGVPSQWDYTPPSTEHLGETARQFEWLGGETEALAAISRGFGNIMENAAAIDPERPLVHPQRFGKTKKSEPQRMTYTRKGKKRKTKRR